MRPVIGGFAAFGFVFFAIGVGILLAQLRSRRRTVPGQGTVVARRAGFPTRSVHSGLGHGPVYYPTVQFVTADGQRIEAESRTGTNLPLGRVGQTVSIRYDPTTPQRFSLTSVSRTAGCVAWAFVLAGGSTLVISCFVLLAV